MWLLLGLILPEVSTFRWYIAYEEQQLLAVFRATYAAYQAKTPRWIIVLRKKEFHIPFPRHTETRYIHLDTSRCKACWVCVQICPGHVFGKVDFRFHRHAYIDQAENCRGCLRCLKACTNQAILAREKTDDDNSR
jgi:NAD-dependent dihydropyrimidine dehydrogenase PreA subunit